MTRLVAITLAATAATVECRAQWTATLLHSSYSEVRAISSELRAGVRDGYAGYWSGSANTWTSLNPPGGVGGVVSGVDGGLLAGSYSLAQSQGRAAMWTVAGAGLIDLHPSGAFRSAVYDVSGGVQVGHAGDDQTFHAAMWNGAASSHVDLHPQGWTGSFANATDGVLQGGTVHMSASMPRAALWSGSAQSFVNLHPSGTHSSHIAEMAPGIQVGWVMSLQGQHEASTWNGTVESWESLHPPGSSLQSGFSATTGTIHAGWLQASGQLEHAAINFGSATEWLDIHQYLPAGLASRSQAFCIDRAGDTLYVGGWAEIAGVNRAVMWVGTVPAPGPSMMLIVSGIVAYRRRRPSTS